MTWCNPFLFGISGGEILILLLLVLLLFGPKKIPEIARMIGRGMNEVKKVQREINTEIHRYSSEIEKEAKEMQSEIKKITEEPSNRNTIKPLEDQNQDENLKSTAATGSEQEGEAADHAGEDKKAHKEEKKEQGKEGDVNDLPYPYGPGSSEK